MKMKPMLCDETEAGIPGASFAAAAAAKEAAVEEEAAEKEEAAEEGGAVQLQHTSLAVVLSYGFPPSTTCQGRAKAPARGVPGGTMRVRTRPSVHGNRILI